MARMRRTKDGKGIQALAILFFLLVVAFIVLPLASLFIKMEWGGLQGYLSAPLVVDALRLSFLTSAVSTLIVVITGTPVAYVNARFEYPAKDAIDTMIDLPVVIPPAVAGLALLMAFGRRGVLGQHLSALGIDLAFTTMAVIMAQVFVSSPFFIRQARTSFEDVDRAYEHAARTLGASPLKTFMYVTVPIAMNGLVSGAILSWARALGEFGATIMFAGNFEGRTQTMPLAIYTAMQGDIDASILLSIILVAISFIVIVAVKMLTRRGLIIAQD
nr:ABC transporter permease [Methanocella conradii]